MEKKQMMVALHGNHVKHVISTQHLHESSLKIVAYVSEIGFCDLTLRESSENNVTCSFQRNWVLMSEVALAFQKLLLNYIQLTDELFFRRLSQKIEIDEFEWTYDEKLRCISSESFKSEEKAMTGRNKIWTVTLTQFSIEMEIKFESQATQLMLTVRNSAALSSRVTSVELAKCRVANEAPVTFVAAAAASGNIVGITSLVNRKKKKKLAGKVIQTKQVHNMIQSFNQLNIATLENCAVGVKEYVKRIGENDDNNIFWKKKHADLQEMDNPRKKLIENRNPIKSHT